MTNHTISRVVPLLLTALAGLSGGLAAAQPVNTPALERLAERAAQQGSVRVIVQLGVPTQVEPALNASAVAAQRRAIGAAQAAVEAQALAGTGARVLRRYETVPYLAIEVDANAMARLRAHGGVSRIDEDELAERTMAQSTALINAPTAWNRGHVGTGWSVAVLDTGVDKNHEFLAGKVVAEACYSTTGTSGANTSNSVCPGGAGSSTAVDSGLPCTGSDDCAHGTHVAGTAAGGTRPADGSHGVAYGASVIAMQVFSLFPNYNGGGVTRALSYTSDQMSALERVYQLRTSHNIAAVNMSLGGGQYSSHCDTDPRKSLVDNLRAAGIATVISSGNSGYRTSMGAPACISTAVSVGATCDTSTTTACTTGVNGVASYSNIASFISLLAPGSVITSSVPGGAYEGWHGTSMAAPHVAGAWAVYKSWQPAASVTDALAAFRANGLTVNDTRSTGSVTGMKRIDLAFIGAPVVTTYALTVTKAGNRASRGTVSSSPAGIACGSDCSESYASGTLVTLTASASSGARFTGWSGACTGTASTCTVTMSGARSVTATFSR